MKHILKILFVVLVLSPLMSVAQTNPPPPNGGAGPEGNDPVGGGAPVGSGIIILLGLSVIYGVRRTYAVKKKELLD
ncbi:MAG: hypothetical protein K9G67_03800 [Bacteroidales bacterium]|nr:hypothetical protein [Bacteroidales bacterium]MCF8343930.1 hypothetical protein [Bacteroidales bacterium]MCF8349937.1 hypothetical protein [Bacteroidales bacterium]MCF8375454.1 hypothetical protein [Bacteroidales bacterium]MCF8401342.1 hypothetical protein [Bacteroidales bacterium]